MGRRSGRAAAKRAAAALESTPKTSTAPEEDATMADVDMAEPESEGIAKDEDEEQSAAEEPDAEPEAEAEPEPDDENEVSVAPKSPTPAPEPVFRKKRLGRPPKNRPPDWDAPVAADRDEPTPRRRGRGGWRGRGGRKGQQPNVAPLPVDKDGKVMAIVNDEGAFPEDPEGEKKVDKLGNLLGDRGYRCRTFTIKGRGDRLYMLSTEPARCVGFRDSYLFFNKHPQLYKVVVDDEEKKDMIERHIIPHSYKGRTIGVVTARSVFREFGALIVVGGRRIKDDYEVTQLRADPTVVEGEVADPHDRYKEGDAYNKNQYVAWHGASAVYHTSGPPGGPPQSTQAAISKKRRPAINDTNWMYEHARAAADFNSEINRHRIEVTKNGVYDIHTNTIMQPASMQPTHARIEQVEDPHEAASAKFPPLEPKMARNFYVTDIYMETPQTGIASAAYENNLDPTDMLAPYRGLSAVSDDIKDLLPNECREAFDEALKKEKEFKGARETESLATHRRQPKIDKALFPYNV